MKKISLSTIEIVKDYLLKDVEVFLELHELIHQIMYLSRHISENDYSKFVTLKKELFSSEVNLASPRKTFFADVYLPHGGHILFTVNKIFSDYITVYTLDSEIIYKDMYFEIK